MNTSIVRLTVNNGGEVEEVAISLKEMSQLYSVPYLGDVFDFVVAKEKLKELNELKEPEPEEDTRPPPVIQAMKVFSNSTVRIRFNEPMKFLTDDREEIIIGLHEAFTFRIKSGLDNSEFTAEKQVKEVELIPEEPELTQEELREQMLLEMVANLTARKEAMSSTNKLKL